MALQVWLMQSIWVVQPQPQLIFQNRIVTVDEIAKQLNIRIGPV
jgi:hypothetical protein